MAELRWVDPEGPEYEAWVALREPILRAPLGLSFSPEDLEAEKGQRHLVAFEDGRVVGGLIVIPLSGGSWKVRQVAVDPDRQGEGLGGRLMEKVIETAHERGIAEIFLHSRAEVTGFYERLGFEVSGEEFIEVGIPHRKMVLSLGSG